VITVNVFHVANLWTFRDGLIHRAELFQSKDQALEAAGPSE
jgi:hypothetical protein